MKCDELKDRWFTAYPTDGICEAEVYGRKEVDEAIAELNAEWEKCQDITQQCFKREVEHKKTIDELNDKIHELKKQLHDLCAQSMDVSGKTIDKVSELKADNESLRKAVSNWHDKYCNQQETIDNLNCKLECVKANKDEELRATKRDMWFARAMRAKTEYHHWILIWHCANTNQYFFINKSRYRHTSKVDRMRYPWEWRDIWSEVEQRCLKKAEEYK